MNCKGGSDIQVQAYYDRTYRLGPQIGETRSTFDLDFIHHLKTPHQDIIWGFGARWSPSTIVQTVPTVDFVPHHQSDNLYSTFVQDQFEIAPDKLSITVGSKFELGRIPAVSHSRKQQEATAAKREDWTIAYQQMEAVPSIRLR